MNNENNITETLSEVVGNAKFGAVKQRQLAHFISKLEGLPLEESITLIPSLSSEELAHYVSLMKDSQKKHEAKKAIEAKELKEKQEAEAEEAKLMDERIRDSYIQNRYKAFVESLPVHYRSASLEVVYKPDNPAYNNLIHSLAFENKSGLITGPNGCGKTFAACAMAKKWVSKGDTVEFMKGVEALALIKEHQLENPYKFIAERFGKDCKHVILDEIDKIRATEADYVYLTYLHDIRYENDMQTIYFGNLKKGQTNKDLVPQSIYSRLKGSGFVVTLDGEDMRLLGL